MANHPIFDDHDATPEEIHQSAQKLIENNGTLPHDEFKGIISNPKTSGDTLKLALDNGQLTRQFDGSYKPNSDGGYMFDTSSSYSDKIFNHPNATPALSEYFLNSVKDHDIPAITLSHYHDAASGAGGVSDELRRNSVIKMLLADGVNHKDFHAKSSRHFELGDIPSLIQEFAGSSGFTGSSEEAKINKYTKLNKFVKNAYQQKMTDNPEYVTDDHVNSFFDAFFNIPEGSPENAVKDTFRSYVDAGVFNPNFINKLNLKENHLDKALNVIKTISPSMNPQQKILMSNVLSHKNLSPSTIVSALSGGVEAYGFHPDSFIKILENPSLPNEVKQKILEANPRDSWNTGYDVLDTSSTNPYSRSNIIGSFLRNPSVTSEDADRLFDGGWQFKLLDSSKLSPEKRMEWWEGTNKKAEATKKALENKLTTVDILIDIVGKNKNMNLAVEALNHPNANEAVFNVASQRRSKAMQDAVAKSSMMPSEMFKERVAQGKIPFSSFFKDTQIVSKIRELSNLEDRQEIFKIIDSKLGSDISTTELDRIGLDKRGFFNAKRTLADKRGLYSDVPEEIKHKQATELIDLIKNNYDEDRHDSELPKPTIAGIIETLIDSNHRGAEDLITDNGSKFLKLAPFGTAKNPEFLDKLAIMLPHGHHGAFELARNPSLSPESFVNVVDKINNPYDRQSCALRYLEASDPEGQKDFVDTMINKASAGSLSVAIWAQRFASDDQINQMFDKIANEIGDESHSLLTKMIDPLFLGRLNSENRTKILKGEEGIWADRDPGPAEQMRAILFQNLSPDVAHERELMIRDVNRLITDSYTHETDEYEGFMNLPHDHISNINYRRDLISLVNQKIQEGRALPPTAASDEYLKTLELTKGNAESVQDVLDFFGGDEAKVDEHVIVTKGNLDGGRFGLRLKRDISNEDATPEKMDEIFSRYESKLNQGDYAANIAKLDETTPLHRFFSGLGAPRTQPYYDKIVDKLLALPDDDTNKTEAISKLISLHLLSDEKKSEIYRDDSMFSVMLGSSPDKPKTVREYLAGRDENNPVSKAAANAIMTESGWSYLRSLHGPTHRSLPEDAAADQVSKVLNGYLQGATGVGSTGILTISKFICGSTFDDARKSSWRNKAATSIFKHINKSGLSKSSQSELFLQIYRDSKGMSKTISGRSLAHSAKLAISSNNVGMLIDLSEIKGHDQKVDHRLAEMLAQPDSLTLDQKVSTAKLLKSNHLSSAEKNGLLMTIENSLSTGRGTPKQTQEYIAHLHTVASGSGLDAETADSIIDRLYSFTSPDSGNQIRQLLPEESPELRQSMIKANTTILHGVLDVGRKVSRNKRIELFEKLPLDMINQSLIDDIDDLTDMEDIVRDQRMIGAATKGWKLEAIMHHYKDLTPAQFDTLLERISEPEAGVDQTSKDRIINNVTDERSLSGSTFDRLQPDGHSCFMKLQRYDHNTDKPNMHHFFRRAFDEFKKAKTDKGSETKTANPNIPEYGTDDYHRVFNILIGYTEKSYPTERKGNQDHDKADRMDMAHQILDEAFDYLRNPDNDIEDDTSQATIDRIFRQKGRLEFRDKEQSLKAFNTIISVSDLDSVYFSRWMEMTHPLDTDEWADVFKNVPSLLYAAADKSMIDEKMFDALDFNFISNDPEAPLNYHTIMGSITSSLDDKTKFKNMDRIVDSLFEPISGWTSNSLWRDARGNAFARTLETLASLGSHVTESKANEVMMKIMTGSFGDLPRFAENYDRGRKDYAEAEAFTRDRASVMLYLSLHGVGEEGFSGKTLDVILGDIESAKTNPAEVQFEKLIENHLRPFLSSGSWTDSMASKVLPYIQDGENAHALRLSLDGSGQVAGNYKPLQNQNLPKQISDALMSVMKRKLEDYGEEHGPLRRLHTERELLKFVGERGKIDENMFLGMHKEVEEDIKANMDDAENNFLSPRTYAPMSFANIWCGGKAIREAKMVPANIPNIDKDKMIWEVSADSKAVTQMNDIIGKIPAEGITWPQFKNQFKQEANFPAIKKVFQSQGNRPVLPEHFAEAIKKEEEGLKKFGITYTHWDNYHSWSQKHNQEKNPFELTVQLGYSDYIDKELQEDPAALELAKQLQIQTQQMMIGTLGLKIGNHPCNPNSISWARVDTSAGEEGWILEEIQSDFERDFRKNIQSMADNNKDGISLGGRMVSPSGLLEISKKIAKAHSGWVEANFKAVEQLARKHGVKKLFMHGIGLRAGMSGYEGTRIPKGWFYTYMDLPKKNNFQQTTYDEYPNACSRGREYITKSGEGNTCWVKKLTDDEE